MKKTVFSYLLLLTMFAASLISGCRDPEAEKKIDGNLRAQLVQYKQRKDLDKNIVILFKVNEDLSELHHEMLQKNSVNINANIGPIYTATVPAKNVYNLAKMRFITYIQSKSKLNAHQPDSTRIKDKD